MTTRRFSFERDFSRIGELEIENYLPGNADGNWLRPVWEYAYFHPLRDDEHMRLWRVWEDGDDIAGVAHYEWFPGEVYVQTFGRERRPALQREMLDYAEREMRGRDEDGAGFVKVWAADVDDGLVAELARRGYERRSVDDRPMYAIDLTEPVDYSIPDGFTLQSLSDENDLEKINRCLWRGFNHEGEPDPDLSSRRRMQQAPRFRRDLTMTVVAPNGEYVAFAGTWVEPSCGYALVEPVATDPDYRRMGLGRAAVLGGLERCAAEGATVGYVGSDQQFYRSIGFRLCNNEECWIRRFG
jgi:predicted N-acetyltransferase YhbS